MCGDDMLSCSELLHDFKVPEGEIMKEFPEEITYEILEKFSIKELEEFIKKFKNGIPGC